jgi:TnpA family transposase
LTSNVKSAFLINFRYYHSLLLYADDSDYDWLGRSAKVYRVEIRTLFNFRVATVQDSQQINQWLITQILPKEQRIEAITQRVYQRFRQLQIEPPTSGRIERLVRSSIHQYEHNFCHQIYSQLTPLNLAQIDLLLTTEETLPTEPNEVEPQSTTKIKTSELAFLKTDPGPVGLGSFLTEIDKLKRLRAVGLTPDLFSGISSKLIKTYRQRAATETPYHLRQHQPAIRYTLMAAFYIQRSQEITDNLIEILTQIIHRISTRAERRINKELVEDFKQVTGKTHLLFRIAEAALNSPDGVIEQVIYPVVSQKTLQKRLLLCLYGMGTNTGLKRIHTGINGEKYQDLLYVRRRYIHKDQLRSAIAEVINAIFEIRSHSIWGEGTTTCASDSKHFGAWEQNLMTQYHLRYGGRGVMIYWHVEKKSTCIYSQLKTCSSSEVAAMIEGVLRHCTNMEVQKNYVDSHGQSEVAFAFTHLLGFQLMPRLKRIKTQKLYRPYTAQSDAYPNLQPILTRPINWDLIRQQYDQMVKYATALRLGTAQTEAILKRFSKNPFKHPTYLALMELGRAIKTIFLCEYLHSGAVRREVNEGLNVVERWNGVNDFIFYGKGLTG